MGALGGVPVEVAPVISNDRVAEHRPFLAASPLRDLSRLQYLYSTFRQGLLEYLSQRPRGTALLPEYVPQGVHDPYLRAGWRIAFYPVEPSLKLEPVAFSRLLEAERPDHVVYIHHFGVYLPENLALLGELLPAPAVLLEDFAHTLPQEDVPVTGRLAAYSFTKTLGVSEGAILWFRDRGDLSPCRYEAAGEHAKTLGRMLERRLELESFLARTRAPRVPDSALRRLLHRPTDYYDFLQQHYPEIRAPIGARSREVLERVDLTQVAARRREIARLYVEGLDPRLLLPVPGEALTRQSLYAFPVLVENRGALHRRLRARGVRGDVLTDHWWFQARDPKHRLLRCHYLLPLNHYMSDRDIERVIAAANSFAAER